MTLVPTDPHPYSREVDHYQQHQVTAIGVPVNAGQPQPSAAVVRLTDWAQEARAAASIATSLVKTSFVPEVFRGKPEEATAAILTGFEMGLSPMAALRAIYVIKGTPAMYAKTMRAVVQSQGHEIWVESATATRVIVKGRRKGSDKVESSTWTVDRAKTAGLLSNQQYTKNPQNMLTARATAEVCWLVASDALHGIAASVEELDGPEDGYSYSAPSEPVTEAPKRTAKRRPLEPMPSAEPAPEPAPMTADEAVASLNGGREPLTKNQMGHMQALFTEKGIRDRAQRLQYVAERIGREVESSKELTKREASDVIEALMDLPAPAAAEPAGDDWPETAQPFGGDES